MTDDGFHEVEVRRGDDGIPRDRWGRYVLPDPETGEKRIFTRVTTIAGTLKDRFGLEKWDQRNIVYGMGQRPSLFAKAAAARRNDERTLQEIADRAKEAADSLSGADLGSALHAFAERADRGEEFEIPAPFDADIAAYRKATEAAGVVTAVGWIERVVIIPDLGVAGMIDRLSNGLWSLPRVGDLKTAADKTYDNVNDAGEITSQRVVNTVLTYGMADIPLQLALYAHSTHWWTGKDWAEMPKVDQDLAMVFHIPAGQAECRIYEIGIAAGWEAVQLAFDIRAWRKRKDLAQLVPVFDVSSATSAAGDGEDEPAVSGPATATAPSPSSIAAVRARVEAIKAHSQQARQWLAARWPVVVPTFPKGGPRTEAELARIAEICERTETQFEIASGAGRDGASTGEDSAGKGGEDVPPSSEDPPAPHPTPNGDDKPRIVIDAMSDPQTFELRKMWASARVAAIKVSTAVHDGMTPRKRLADLWSARDEIPRFPKGGPRTDDELSVVIGLCDLVEMEFGLPFGPSDPTAPKQTKATRQKDSRS